MFKKCTEKKEVFWRKNIAPQKNLEAQGPLFVKS